ncbi:MAG: hypothetical protein ACREN5_10085, partial [Gemmatimonadales bacterium]
MHRGCGVIHVLALAFLAGCAPVPGSAPAPTITTGPLSWKIERDEYSFSATGSAPVQVSESTHAYLLVYRVYWDKRLTPSDGADTAIASALLVPGVSDWKVSISDYASRCREYSRGECISLAEDPVARIELAGWT